MSYSFNIKAANKEDAKIAATGKFDEMAAQQPVHQRDRAAVLANIGAVVDLLTDDENKDVSVSCNGYVSWSTGATAEDAEFSAASISCTASHAARA